MIKIEDIPYDVLWVWNIQWLKYPIGLDTLNKMKSIIRANPKYFPWETKYDSIPKEVHDAYWKELHDEQDRKWAEYVNGKEKSGGFIGMLPALIQMNEASKEPPPEPQKSLTEIMSDLFKMQEDKREAEDEKHKQDKALWDKYYKPYGLEYRK